MSGGVVGGVGCKSSEVRGVFGAAKVLYDTYVKEEMYSPIDKLANASSVQNLLVALYEVVRGLKAEDRERLSYVVNAIEEDVAKAECVEEALKLAKRLAVRALSLGTGERGEGEGG